MISGSSLMYSLEELDRQHRRILDLQDDVYMSPSLYCTANSVYKVDSLWQHSIQMKKERDSLKRNYSRGICRLFCDNFRRVLPRELRDIVYDYINVSKRKSVAMSPATRENLEYYGHEVTAELTESYYRYKTVSAYVREPPLQADMFDEDMVGVAPANIARSITLTLWKTPAFFQQATEVNAAWQCRDYLYRLQRRPQGFKLVFELETSVNHTIDEPIGCVESYFQTLQALYKDGNRVSISMDIGKLEETKLLGPLSNSPFATRHYVFVYPVSAATFADFKTRVKQEALSIGIQTQEDV